MANPKKRGAKAPAKSSPGYALVIGAAALAGTLALAATAHSQVDRYAAELASCPAGEECITIHTGDAEHIFTVEYAIDPAERSCGLMYREEMARDHGMVFDFEVERGVSFWMSNTLISLDMVFIEDDGTVLNIAEGTTPLSLEGVPSAGPVRYVLEVIAGTADRIGLEPGDRVDIERAPGMTEGTAVCFPPPA